MEKNMNQLLNKGFNTTKLTNTVLKNYDKNIIVLREDKLNTYEFSKYQDFKNVCLDISREYNGDVINDIAIVITKPGQENNIGLNKNRYILILESQASFIKENQEKFNLENGDLFWSNEELIIHNHSQSDSIILILDIEDFII